MSTSDPHRRRRVTRADVGRLAAAWVVTALALRLADALLSDLDAESKWDYLWVAAIAGVIGLFLRPIMVRVSAWIGWIAVLLVALFGQALILTLAMMLLPGIGTSFGAAFLAAWIAAVAGTAVSYVTTSGSNDGLVHALARRGEVIGRDTELTDPEVDGVVFVQMDGVPFPVLRWAVQAGGVPTVRRWLGSGEYVLREWTAQLPCTTPASQMGILHGTIDAIPAFRWYDRDLRRVIVANRPPDARIIEERSSDGRGLLYDGGVSISNMFTGDATRSLLTMSRSTGVSRGAEETRRVFAWFFATPSGFSRSLTRTVVEIVKERFQARAQVRRDLQPRVHRGWTFAGLRAATNALLRDVNLALVAEEMSRGTKSIYVDFVDYDEIAHHAGIFRPESLASLDGLDRVLHSLQQLAQNAPRRYHIVALSDHGQSQGATFKDRYGMTLGDLCQQLMAEEVSSHEAPVEGLGRAESMVSDVGQGGLPGRVAGSVGERIKDKQLKGQGEEGDIEDNTHVFGSGNLGLVYVRGDHRHTLEELDGRWPALVPGLIAHPGVSFVAVRDDEGRHWAIGPEGRMHLETEEVEGVDPLARYRPHAARALLRATCMAEAPDIYVNSLMDDTTNDIAAFEELVGAHGGLGGWQDRAVLLVPAELAHLIPSGLEGADQVHRALVDVLRHLGHRTDEVTDAGRGDSPVGGSGSGSAAGAGSSDRVVPAASAADPVA